MGRARELGQGKIGCILWAVLFALSAWTAYKLIPIKIQSAQLQDFMVETAQFAGNRSEEVIHQRILTRAAELDLPLTAKNLKVSKPGGRVRIQATYTIPVDLGFTVYEWNFEHEIDRQVFDI